MPKKSSTGPFLGKMLIFECEMSSVLPLMAAGKQNIKRNSSQLLKKYPQLNHIKDFKKEDYVDVFFNVYLAFQCVNESTA